MKKREGYTDRGVVKKEKSSWKVVGIVDGNYWLSC